MVGLLQRAGQGLNLTPGERAVVKLLKGILGTALIAAFLAVAQIVVGTDPAHIQWPVVGSVAVGAFTHAVWGALSKYYTAQGDQPLESSWSPAGAAPPPGPTPAPAPAGGQ